MSEELERLREIRREILFNISSSILPNDYLWNKLNDVDRRISDLEES